MELPSTRSIRNVRELEVYKPDSLVSYIKATGKYIKKLQLHKRIDLNVLVHNIIHSAKLYIMERLIVILGITGTQVCIVSSSLEKIGLIVAMGILCRGCVPSRTWLESTRSDTRLIKSFQYILEEERSRNCGSRS